MKLRRVSVDGEERSFGHVNVALRPRGPVRVLDLIRRWPCKIDGLPVHWGDFGYFTLSEDPDSVCEDEMTFDSRPWR